MAEWVLAPDIEKQIDKALERARHAAPYPQAHTAEYNRSLDAIILRIDNGRRLIIPREDLQGLQDATPEQISDIQIFGGTDIAWPQLDLDHNLLSLLEGRYGSDKWMASLGHREVAA